MTMDIAFDPAKDHQNLTKHGLSLALAAELEWDLIRVTEDSREAYGEQRWIGFAPIGRTVYCVVFTEDDNRYRIISLRKATPKEVRDYARHI
jgi:hypothetical protein